ncbi:MAG TPA: hypothetical protein VFP22_06800 [Candidatus Limnocylindrales bacterium]|nr:hypothetical protein [Candidatus Limnocylindrales bacterium]
MTFHDEARRLHRLELDREIEAIVIARRLADTRAGLGFVRRLRRRTGDALISAGRALGGSDTRRWQRFEA